MFFTMARAVLFLLAVVVAPIQVLGNPVAQALSLQMSNSTSTSLCTTYLLLNSVVPPGAMTTSWAVTTTSISTLDCRGCSLAVQVHYACCQGVKALIRMTRWTLMNVIDTWVQCHYH